MLDYVAKMARTHHEATEADVQRLRDVGFTDADILHIIYWIAGFNMANTISDCVGLEVHEHMTAVFVDELPTARLGNLGRDAGGMAQREALRAGQERAVVRALEGYALEWINSPPLTWERVAGKPLLVIYWDATHLNSLLAVERLQHWHDQYAATGLTIIAAHTPEFPGARDPALVHAEVARLGITYPVTLDPTFRKQTGANNRYWPAIHLVDRNGFVRYRHYGPGGFAAIDAILPQLLGETPTTLPQRIVHDHRNDRNEWLHPEATAEIYATQFASTGVPLDERVQICAPGTLPVELAPGRLYLEGDWTIDTEGARLHSPTGAASLAYNATRVGIYLTPGDHGPTTLSTQGDADAAGATITADRARCYTAAHHDQLAYRRLRLNISGAGTVLHRISLLPFRADVPEDDEET
jgi:hypothetical protein